MSDSAQFTRNTESMSVKLNTIAVDSQAPDRGVIAQASAALLRGELVVGPTETRYALLARADSDEALERLFAAKGRPRKSLSAIFVRSIKRIESLAEYTTHAAKLAKMFLPGPLTLVMKRNPDSIIRLSELVSQGETIGIRHSSCPFIEALLEQVEAPLTATSANRSGSVECTSIDEIQRDLGSAVALYCDSGELTAQVSTVVDVSAGDVRILREGNITREQIDHALRAC
jgi:L-threonylcarbamoyladenylate synthase